MQQLAKQVTDRLKTHKSCTVFESHLARVWANDDRARERRHAAIKAFAKAHGWSATILDPGIRVTFRPLKESKTRNQAKAS